MSNQAYTFTWDQLTSSLIHHVARADLSMQIRQKVFWEDAPEFNLLAEGMSAVNDTGSSPTLLQVFPDLMEDMEEQCNLGLSEVTFGFHLEQIRPSWIKRIWHKLRNNMPSMDQFQFTTSKEKFCKKKFSIQVMVNKNPAGNWQINANSSSKNPLKMA